MWNSHSCAFRLLPVNTTRQFPGQMGKKMTNKWKHTISGLYWRQWGWFTVKNVPVEGGNRAHVSWNSRLIASDLSSGWFLRGISSSSSSSNPSQNSESITRVTLEQLHLIPAQNKSWTWPANRLSAWRVSRVLIGFKLFSLNPTLCNDTCDWIRYRSLICTSAIADVCNAQNGLGLMKRLFCHSGGQKRKTWTRYRNFHWLHFKWD